ncbi:MAG TPA: AAA family ATPase, partial [Verrucomicrobiae bacterium]|nr:AAA family ATPase [Verrucomicrobiae bacterium]
QETKIIAEQSAMLLESSGVNIKVDRDAVEILATTFHELREGVTVDGNKLDRPANVMSTAEAVSVYYQSAISAYYYDEGKISMERMLQNLVGAVVKEGREDVEKLKSYLNVVVKAKSMKEGGLWKDYYAARKWLK